MAELIILEDFYSDPDYVRNYALNELEWHDKKGNHPGRRSDPDRHPSVKKLLENTIQKEVTDWDVEWNYSNGAYNLCKAWDKCWIHSDWGTTYACVVYLTPDAPIESGTALYKHKKTGYRIRPEDKELAEQLDDQSNDFTAWEMTDYVGNIYNRAVIYKGKYYHSAVQYFGNTDEYCRMHQTFFFSTVD